MNKKRQWAMVGGMVIWMICLLGLEVYGEGVQVQYLNEAARQGHLEMVKYLIEKGEPMDQQYEGGKTALHLAAGEGRYEVIQYLIEKGADVNIQDGEGKRALDDAVMNGYIESGKLLLERGSEVDVEKCYGWSALHLAIWDKDKEKVKELLDGGADVNMRTWKGRTPLHWSSWRGWADGIVMLLGRGVNIDERDDQGMTALYLASWKEKNWEVVEKLLKGGASLDIKNNNGRTALHKAVMKQNLLVVRIFLEEMESRGLKLEGIELLTKNKDVEGKTPMALAVEGGNLEIFKAFMDYYQTLDPKDKIQSLVESAIKKADASLIISKLKDVGVDLDINVQEEMYGLTMLHFAAGVGHLKLVQDLVEKSGADVNLKDNRGMTAKDFAKVGGYDMVVEYLESVMAEDQEGQEDEQEMENEDGS